MTNSQLRCPLKGRREFALWAHAAVCFRNCADACDFVVTKQLSEFDALYKPLTAIALIEYAKPFKRSKGLPAAPEIVVPAGKQPFHKSIIRFRDKIVAHLDTTREMVEFQPYLHCVRIDFNERSIDYIVEEPKVHRAILPKLKSLAQELATKAHYHVSRHMKALSTVVKRARTGLGEYIVDLDDAEGGLRCVAEHEKAVVYWD